MALRCLHIPELGPESGGRRGQPPKQQGPSWAGRTGQRLAVLGNSLSGSLGGEGSPSAVQGPTQQAVA